MHQGKKTVVRSRRAALAALLLFLVVLGVFLPAARNGFVNYGRPRPRDPKTPMSGPA